MIVRLKPIKEEIVGGHMHRSGWPFALHSVKPLFDDSANIVFDDFLEKTICNQRNGLNNYVHKQPWVGFCHYPYDTPEWYETEHLRDLPKHASWSESIAKLKLCITLGKNLSDWIKENWNVPCTCIKHPTEVPQNKWTISKFINNRKPLILQVGWYLRNTYAIFQLDAPSNYTKAWLRSRRPIAERNHIKCKKYYLKNSSFIGKVEQIEPVDNNNYDDLLAKNIVFIELLTSVANNTIIECIARNTPILVNRLPGPEFYLGTDYPLFYDNIKDIKNLISMENIVQAHEYLVSLDKTWIKGEVFRHKISEACVKYIPELLY